MHEEIFHRPLRFDDKGSDKASWKELTLLCNSNLNVPFVVDSVM
jgi:hypothetical protein